MYLIRYLYDWGQSGRLTWHVNSSRICQSFTRRHATHWQLFDEANLLNIAHQYQQVTDWHTQLQGVLIWNGKQLLV